jgi:hypothetical protein
MQTTCKRTSTWFVGNAGTCGKNDLGYSRWIFVFYREGPNTEGGAKRKRT